MVQTRQMCAAKYQNTALPSLFSYLLAAKRLQVMLPIQTNLDLFLLKSSPGRKTLTYNLGPPRSKGPTAVEKGSQTLDRTGKGFEGRTTPPGKPERPHRLMCV